MITCSGHSIMEFARVGDIDSVKKIVSVIPDSKNFFPVSVRNAMENGHFEVVKFLVDNGAPLDPTPAAEYGHLDILKYLVDIKGADIHVYDDWSIYSATENGHVEVVKFLAERSDSIPSDLSLYAAKQGNVELLKFFHSKNLDLRYSDDHPFRLAAEGGHLECVKFLYDFGADIRNKNERALKKAVGNGHFNVVKFLVEKGVDVHVDNDVCLLLAIERERLDIIQYLLELGLKSNAKLSSRIKNYLSFCQKQKDRIRARAVNKIGTWWIPICYRPTRDSGKRMAEASWKKYEAVYA